MPSLLSIDHRLIIRERESTITQNVSSVLTAIGKY